jgi:hypothetical protein
MVACMLAACGHAFPDLRAELEGGSDALGRGRQLLPQVLGQAVDPLVLGAPPPVEQRRDGLTAVGPAVPHGNPDPVIGAAATIADRHAHGTGVPGSTLPLCTLAYATMPGSTWW